MNLTSLYHRALAEYEARRLASAATLFRAVLARRPHHPGALHFLGLATQLSGHPRRALPLLRQSVLLQPANAIYALNLGNLLYELRRLPDAIVAWESAGRIDATLEDAFTNIGLTCAETDQHERAASAFRTVTELNPDSAPAWRRLAASLRHLGCRDDARLARERGRSLAQNPEALARFAAARLEAERAAESLAALRRAVRLAPLNAELHFQLARLHAYRGNDPRALRSFKHALELNPQHASARFWLDSLEGRTPPSPPAGHIVRLFDAFSAHYDHQMVEWLHYRGPALLWRAVRRVLARQGQEARGLDVLDAGCGTGLSARVLREASDRLVGVDLSPGMVEKAAARGSYDEVVVGDLVAFLASARQRFDLVFSADVFIYFGDLSIPLRAAAGAIRPGGLVAFTVETARGEGYAVTRTGRYTHALSYVRRTAVDCGFQLQHTGTGTPRFERGAPVSALVAVLQKKQP